MPTASGGTDCDRQRPTTPTVIDNGKRRPRAPFSAIGVPTVSRHPTGQATTTGILPIRACHSRGPVWCTDSPVESTATVTGMSCTVNS